MDFNREIRPILAANCFACHGPDAAERKADLRLDTKAGALADLGGHAALVPGKPDESELVRRIASADPDEMMPPAASGKKLSAEQIELLRRWVAEGARWQEHWAYAKPSRPSVPRRPARSTAANPIDLFVRARLAGVGLSPAARGRSRDARAPVVVRSDGAAADAGGGRRAFCDDDSPQAYENLVDRLLASPHYGERMAMYWLDVVRFADTNGYHGDNHRDIALFRDYVIDAFNRQQAVRSLHGRATGRRSAGRRLARDTNRLGLQPPADDDPRGGAQAKEYLAKYAADRVRNASTRVAGGHDGLLRSVTTTSSIPI